MRVLIAEAGRDRASTPIPEPVEGRVTVIERVVCFRGIRQSRRFSGPRLVRRYLASSRSRGVASHCTPGSPRKSPGIGAIDASRLMAAASAHGGAAMSTGSIGCLRPVIVTQQLGSTETTAQVHPAKFTAAMMRAAEEKGAELRPRASHRGGAEQGRASVGGVEPRPARLHVQAAPSPASRRPPSFPPSHPERRSARACGVEEILGAHLGLKRLPLGRLALPQADDVVALDRVRPGLLQTRLAGPVPRSVGPSSLKMRRKLSWTFITRGASG